MWKDAKIEKPETKVEGDYNRSRLVVGSFQDEIYVVEYNWGIDKTTNERWEQWYNHQYQDLVLVEKWADVIPELT